jgi:hypothetical protein
MMKTVEHYLKEPCPAVRAELETMKRFPGLQVGILYQVLSLVPVLQEQRRHAMQVAQVRHRRRLEAFELNLRTKKHRRSK